MRITPITLKYVHGIVGGFCEGSRDGVGFTFRVQIFFRVHKCTVENTLDGFTVAKLQINTVAQLRLH